MEQKMKPETLVSAFAALSKDEIAMIAPGKCTRKWQRRAALPHLI